MPTVWMHSENVRATSLGTFETLGEHREGNRPATLWRGTGDEAAEEHRHGRDPVVDDPSPQSEQRRPTEATRR